MLHLRAHYSEEVDMARFRQAHPGLVHAEYEYLSARDAEVGNYTSTSKASPCTVEVEWEDSVNGVNWDELFSDDE